MTIKCKMCGRAFPGGWDAPEWCCFGCMFDWSDGEPTLQQRADKPETNPSIQLGDE